MSFDNLIRQDLQHFAPYASARSEKVQGSIWLNANEMPDQAGESHQLNRYPDPQPAQLINHLADYHQVSNDQLLVTRGSDEGIDLLVRLFCSAREDSAAALVPTFGMYQVCCHIQGIEYISIDLVQQNGQFDIDYDRILDSLKDNTKLLFLCHPNNPTGNLLDKNQIQQLLQTLDGRCVVVIDEAYIDFADDDGFVQFINTYNNLVVLRTMSKAFSLAAARIGILIANKFLIQWLKKIMPPYPLAEPATEAAVKALDDTAVMQTLNKINGIIEQRSWLYKQLSNLSIIEKVWPSQANFLLFKSKQPLMTELLESGIVIRSMEKAFACNTMYRVSVGLSQENKQFIESLRQVSNSSEHTTV